MSPKYQNKIYIYAQTFSSAVCEFLNYCISPSLFLQINEHIFKILTKTLLFDASGEACFAVDGTQITSPSLHTQTNKQIMENIPTV